MIGVVLGCAAGPATPIALASEVEAAPAAPDELAGLSLEELLGIEVVYAASKHEQRVADAPASVTVVTADEIQKSGYRTLAEIMNSVRGFYVTWDRNYAYLGVRGFGRPGDYNSRILLLVNGHRLNDGLGGAASFGPEFPVDVDLIERVEVVRGPSSSIYGTSAFMAVVNVVTADGGQRDGLSASVQAGSFNHRETQLTYSHAFDSGAEVLVSGSLSESDGEDLFFREFDDPETNNGVSENGDYAQSENVFALVSYKNFTLQGAFVSSEKGIPTAAYDSVFNDPRSFTVDENAHLDLKYERTFGSQMSLMARAFVDRYDYDGDYVYDYSEEGDEGPYIVVNKDWSRASWWGTELQLSKMFSETHRLIFGLDFQDNAQMDQGNFDEEIYSDDRNSSSSWGVYAQDEMPLGDKVVLHLGLRYDDYETFGGTANPRVSMLYSPRESSTLKFLYGTAFRAPNALELYYNDGGSSQKANLDLEPEEIRTYEFVWEQEIGRSALGSVSLFHNDIENLINLVLDPEDDLLVHVNLGRVQSEGIEAELQRRWPGRLTTMVSYSYQETEETITGESLSNSPEHLAKLRTSAPLFGSDVFANLELDFRGKTLTVRGNRADDYVVANFTLSGSFWRDRLRASASVFNLFDEEYGHVVSDAHLQDVIVQDGRTWRLNLRFDF